ncbi:hypothetical protein ACFWSF_23935 [Streptomyces sp. NPDC058611]|uniref:hypothetical protein n=1 Tax=unclassified Streptomyces TaxID=2593676 RepID=UPI003649FF1D
MFRIASDTDESPGPEADQPPPEDDHAFLGHPRGLATLSGLEVWERFSFLGMQAILVLYFADAVSDGGLGMNPGTAASVPAAYGTMGYLVSVAGGRLGEHQGRHWGFSAAAIGMTFGLIQYVLGRRRLAGHRHCAEFALAPAAMRRAVWRIVAGCVAFAAVAILPALAGRLTMALWFLSLALALANGIQAQVVKLYDQVSHPVHFGVDGAVAVAVGLAVLALAPWLRRTMHPVH